MASTVKHIFILICVFSVFSLTLQASIINVCKGGKIFKNQNQTNPITEEEEEQSHDGDEKADEVFYLPHDHSFITPVSVKKTGWLNLECKCLSYTKSIPIPPPKF